MLFRLSILLLRLEVAFLAQQSATADLTGYCLEQEPNNGPHVCLSQSALSTSWNRGSTATLHGLRRSGFVSWMLVGLEVQR
jgi:hypothetical protein